MNKKNYKKNLKISFIICGIMFVVILLIFVFSVLVNNNVAENMTGRLLYMNEAELLIYDFDNKKILEPAMLNGQKVADACLVTDDDICAAVLDEDGLKIVTSKVASKEPVKLFEENGVKRLISLETDRNKKSILFAYVNEDNYTVVKTINISDGTVNDLLMNNEKEITSVCFNYDGDGAYVFAKGTNTLIYTEKMELLCSIKGDAESVCAFKDGVIISKDNEYKYLYKFYIATGNESGLKFCDGHNTYTVCQVGDNKYIAGSDKNGNVDIYVCNGSNMDPVDAVNNDMKNIPLDYIENGN